MKFFLLVLVAAITFLSVAQGDEWLQWRGPNSDGASMATNLPESWSVDEKENVAWVAALDGPGSSTPVVTEKFIYLTQSVGTNRALHASCFRREDGASVWSIKLADGRSVRRKENLASPSPICDKERLYFSFGEGTHAALSFDGKILWSRNLEEDHNSFTQNFGSHSTPLLHNGRLYISVLRSLVIPKGLPIQGDVSLESLVLAVDAQTGETIWSVERPTDAEGESRDSYATPMLCSAGLIVSGADLITCHDLVTGKERWRYDYSAERRIKNWRLVPTPVIYNDLILSTYPRGKKMFALTSSGKLAWQYEGCVPDVCTPALLDGKLFVLDGAKKALTCLKVETGEQVWEQKMEATKTFYASPTVADGKVYMINLAGEVFVYEASDKPKQLSSFSIGESRCYSTLVAVDQELFIRTPTRLICVKK
jgi:outer membrane protein assembly factor BamB